MGTWRAHSANIHPVFTPSYQERERDSHYSIVVCNRLEKTGRYGAINRGLNLIEKPCHGVLVRRHLSLSFQRLKCGTQCFSALSAWLLCHDAITPEEEIVIGPTHWLYTSHTRIHYISTGRKTSPQKMIAISFGLALLMDDFRCHPCEWLLWRTKNVRAQYLYH